LHKSLPKEIITKNKSKSLVFLKIIEHAFVNLFFKIPLFPPFVKGKIPSVPPLIKGGNKMGI